MMSTALAIIAMQSRHTKTNFRALLIRKSKVEAAAF